MDSSAVTQKVINQVLAESSVANARVLIEKLQDNCFEKCAPRSSSASLSSGDQACVKMCIEKYMAAWNRVNGAYIDRLRQSQGNNEL
ncbi:hypothetical protein CDD83_33 [Cordyceps sp. RAO-2017]|nr:hypothetical protein CDD83_33 [Cordyceps sp. RAO-2017]